MKLIRTLYKKILNVKILAVNAFFNRNIFNASFLLFLKFYFIFKKDSEYQWIKDLNNIYMDKIFFLRLQNVLKFWKLASLIEY